MFDIDDQQSHVIRRTVGLAFGFWLAGQIADVSLFERLLNQVAILALAAGALRVWILEVGKGQETL
jgi:hypothetical protein